MNIYMEKEDCFLWTTSNTNMIIGEKINDRTGNCVSISKNGNVLAIGEQLATESLLEGCGRVRVMKKSSNNSGWCEIFRTRGDNKFSLLGHSISLSGDGNTLVVGDPFYDNERGKVSVYRDILKGNDRIKYYEFIGDNTSTKAGWDVSVSYEGDTIAYCNSYYSLEIFAEQGGICIKKFDNGKWNTTYSNNMEDENLYSSQAVSISNDGTSVIVLEKGLAINSDSLSEPVEDNDNLITKSRVKIMSLNERGKWVQNGIPIENIDSSNNANHAIALSGDGNTFIIGERSFGLGDEFINIGRIRVFTANGRGGKGTNWVLKGNEILGDNIGDCAGNSVGITDDGEIIIIGEQKFSYLDEHNEENDRADIGRVRLMRFCYDLQDWVQNGNSIEGEIEGDDAGTAVDISGDGEVVVVGEPLHGVKHYNGNKLSFGRVRVFDRGNHNITESVKSSVIEVENIEEVVPNNEEDEVESVNEEIDVKEIEEDVKSVNLTINGSVVNASVSVKDNGEEEVEFLMDDVQTKDLSTSSVIAISNDKGIDTSLNYNNNKINFNKLSNLNLKPIRKTNIVNNKPPIIKKASEAPKIKSIRKVSDSNGKPKIVITGTNLSKNKKVVKRVVTKRVGKRSIISKKDNCCDTVPKPQDQCPPKKSSNGDECIVIVLNLKRMFTLLLFILIISLAVHIARKY